MIPKPPVIAGVDLGGSKVAISYNCLGAVTLDFVEALPGTRADRIAEVIDYITKHDLFMATDYFFIEEPQIGRGVRASMQISQMAGAFMLACAEVQYTDLMLVPVGTWKKQVVGNGAAKKPAVASWLEANHPHTYIYCGGPHHPNQDLIDAACIGLYGAEIVKQSGSLELTGSDAELHEREARSNAKSR